MGKTAKKLPEQNLGCPKCVPNSFGTMNRVVEVPA